MKQSSIDREMTLELTVGTFMFMILLALGYFTIVLGRASLFEKKYPMEVEFVDVMGLRKDDNVVLRGMTIGKVKSLQLSDGRVRVLAMLDNPVRLREDYKIVIVTTSILGGRYLELREGSPKAPPLKQGVMPQGDKPFDLMAEAAAAVHDIRSSLNEGGIRTNIEVAVASFREIAVKINKGEGTLGKLVNEDGAYEDFRAIERELTQVATNFRNISERIANGEGTLGKLIADDSVYTNVQQVAANLREISDRLAAGEGTLGRLLSKDDQLYRDFAATAASLSNLTAKIERGEGLIGKLMNDDSLYTDAKGALSEVRQAVEDYRETSPVVSFTTLLFGAF
jgi:phospholipid/cholesterol/gamma-HCH transport system substrate-binding protein